MECGIYRQLLKASLLLIGTWKIGPYKNLDFLEVNESFILTRWFLEHLLSFHIRPHYPCHSQDPKMMDPSPLISPLFRHFLVDLSGDWANLAGGPRGRNGAGSLPLDAR